MFIVFYLDIIGFEDRRFYLVLYIVVVVFVFFIVLIFGFVYFFVKWLK